MLGTQGVNASAALERLRTAAAARHVRLDELFADFDRLRTGLVTRPQLERCVSTATNVILDNSTWDALFAQMPKRSDGMVAYGAFVELLRGGTERHLPQIGSELTPHLAAALQAVRNHCLVHGITIRSAFQDFDSLNRGVVTPSQFLRCLPVPSTIAPELKQLLADHYRRTDGSGSDYYQLMRDVEGYPEPGTSARPPTRGAGGLATADSNEAAAIDAAQLVDQLAAAFHRTRVRPVEFFRDFDRLRKGLVTESQFVSGLALACGAPGGLRLSHTAMVAVAQHFSAPGGFVRYRDFCHRTDLAFLTGREEDLVRVPTADVAPLLRSQVLCETQPLVDEDEATLQGILERLRALVEARRISVHPLLQDADRRLGFTKGVTAGQLRRVMDTLGLTLSDTDMPFLIAKFSNPVTGHFNYHAFCAAIDPSTKFGQTEQLYTDTQALSLSHTQPLPRTPPPAPVDVEELLDKIRIRVLERALRPADVFADSDPLRLGRIHRDRFTRAVGMLTTELTEGQLAALADFFAAPPDQVDWRRFVKAVDSPSGATDGLLQTLRSTTRERTREGKFDPALLAQFREAMAVAGAHMGERRFDLAGQLADPDRTRCSRITESQFVRVLSLAPLGLSPAQIRVIALYYLDSAGVDYPAFLRDVTPVAPLDDLFQAQTTRRQNIARPSSQPSGDSVDDPVAALLSKVYRKVVRERVGLRQTMKDFDRHAHGRITTTEFQRCLSMANLALNPAELASLAAVYASPEHAGYVDYARFCTDVDAAFATPSLERNPTLQATAFIPPADIEVAAQTRKVRIEESAVADELMSRMASRVSKNRMVVLPPFKDFDRAVIGTVSKPQFLRVLLSLGLTDGATEAEVAALVRRYAVAAGGREDVHYRSFCTDLEAQAAAEHSRTISIF